MSRAQGLYSNDFNVAMSARRYIGASNPAYPGYNRSANNGDNFLINPIGMQTMVTPSNTGETVQCVSDNAADVGIALILNVLDENGEEQTGLAILNGTTPVNVTTTSLAPLLVSRINAINNRSNPGLATQGNVRVRNVVGDTVYSGFQAEDQRTLITMFTIPSNKVGFLLPAEISVNRSGGGSSTVVFTIYSRIRYPDTNAVGPWINGGRWGLHETGTSVFLVESFDRPFIPPLTDVYVAAMSDTNGTDVTARLPIWLANSDYYAG